MACLFCGKDIGPFRILRDREFCSSVHRKRYGERLGRALDQIVVPDLVSRKIADYRIVMPPRDGGQRDAKGCWYFELGHHETRIGRRWPLQGTQVLTTRFRPPASPRILEARWEPAPRPASGWMASRLHLPILAVDLAVDDARQSDTPEVAGPSWMTAAVAQAAERLVQSAVASNRVSAMSPVTQKLPELPIGANRRPVKFEWIAAPVAERAEIQVRSRWAEVAAAFAARRFAPPVPQAALRSQLRFAPLARSPRATSVEAEVRSSWIAALTAVGWDIRTQRFTIDALPDAALTLAQDASLTHRAKAPAEWAEPAAAEIVEAEVYARYEAVAAANVTPGVSLSAVLPSAATRAPWLAAFATSPAAEPVSTEIHAHDSAVAVATVPAIVLRSSLPPIVQLDPRLAPFSASPAAEAAEMEVFARSAAVAAATSPTVVLPSTMPPAVYFEPSLAPIVKSPAAEAVEMEVFARSTAVAAAASPVVVLPSTMPPAVYFEPSLAPIVKSPAAEAVEMEVFARSTAVAAAASPTVVLPLTMPPAVYFEPSLAPAVKSPAAEAAENEVHVNATAVNAPVTTAAPVVPWTIAAAAYIEPPFAAVSGSPAAEAAGTEVLATIQPVAAPFEPAAVTFGKHSATVADARGLAQFLPAPAAEPVAIEIAARAGCVAPAVSPISTALPSGLIVTEFGRAIATADRTPVPALAAGMPWSAAAAAPLQPSAVESMPAIEKFVAVPLVVDLSVKAPDVSLAIGGDLGMAPFETETRVPVFSEHLAPNAGGAMFEPLFTTPDLRVPMPAHLERKAVVPVSGMIAMDFYCQRINSSPTASGRWTPRAIAPLYLPFQMRPILERLEDLVPKKPERKQQPAEVIALPDVKPRLNRPGFDRTAKIAAAVMMAAFLWLGARSMNSAKPTAPISTFGSAADVSSPSARPADLALAPHGTGPLARMRQAIASRATVEMTDSFRTGMENWGSNGKSWMPGWSHHPDGYVRTGELAMFKPSSKFTDYRLEFYGQIESKSIGWTVRSQDKQNYYAMKFTVVEAGLRPIIALVHYPVVGGKRGSRVQTPLSVMVHNNQPYHVTVDVRGNKFTTSIEGEEVGSWSDNSLTAGGIGFFSEAGERARLYWMKVSKNDDWLGRFCSYLAGDGAAQTAEMWGPRIPLPKREPAKPAPLPPALAAAGSGFQSFSSPQRARMIKHERTPAWTS